MTSPLFLAPVDAARVVDPSAALSRLTPAGLAVGKNAGATNAFTEMVSQGLQQVNDRLLDSQVDMQRMASGGSENLHQVMIRLEESRLSFQLMLQVRNRLLESYQELMRMQI